MSDQPRMTDHPEIDESAADSSQPDSPGENAPEEEGVSEPTDPADPLKRDEDMPGADPVVAPVPPG